MNAMLKIEELLVKSGISEEDADKLIIQLLKQEAHKFVKFSNTPNTDNKKTVTSKKQEIK